jgi:hypothetical protein
MSAYADDRKTLAYRLGESLSSMTDHYLIMTATLHKCNSDVYVRRPTVFLLTSSCLRGIR